MNLTEYEIRKKYRYSKLSYVFDVYMECEYRANLTEDEYEGLLPGEFRFDYISWAMRLGFSKYQIESAIKELVKTGVISQTFKGVKGNQSKYFLTRFNQKNFQKNEEKNNQKNKVLKIEGLRDINQKNNQKNNQKKNLQSSQYNNLNIESNNNTIYKYIVSSTEVQRIISEWNSLGLNKVVSINPGTNRYKSLKARINEYGENNIISAIKNINNSSFLKGQNKNNWIITFDWLIKPNNFSKVLEGNYTDIKNKETESSKKIDIYDFISK